MATPKSSRHPFKAEVSIGLARVRVDDDPEAWSIVSAALSRIKATSRRNVVKKALAVRFDGDLDNPSNFEKLGAVPGSIDFRSMDSSKGQFGDLAFQVQGMAADASPEALEDLLHAIVIDLGMDGEVVNVGDWEEFSIELHSG